MRPMTASPRAKTRVWTGQNSNTLLGPAMILPAVVALAMFQYLPLITAVLNSLQSFSPFDQSSTGWVGFSNYADIFADPAFRYAMFNTFLYIILMLALTIPLALLLAVLLDRRLPGTTWTRNAIIGALAASEAVTALIWGQMYEPGSGLFNAVLDAFGLPAQSFLTGSGQALISIVVMTVWKDVGLPMLIFLAGLQAIPRELHEAAQLDGATEWQIFHKITLPQLRPSIVVALFMMTITATKLFTPILIMTQGGPEGATTNLALYAYIQGFEFQSQGTASASVVCMLIVLAIVTVAQSYLLRGQQEN